MSSINEKWHELWNEIEENPNQQLVYVLGATDSGKTTLCQYLFRQLSNHFTTAYIDCDPGQSVIGPSTTLGLKFKKKTETEYLHFVGSTSPIRHLLQTLVGIKKLTEKAVQLGAQKIILDSSGFVLGKPAREFQFQVIDLLQPDFLVALQRSDELQNLMLNFDDHIKIKTHYFVVSSSVQTRDQEERQHYRQKKFKDYFENAAIREFNWRRIGLHGMIPDVRQPNRFRNLLIALCDSGNFVVTLGIIRYFHVNEKTLILYSPPFDPRKVATIQFGSIYLNKKGEQLSY